MATPEVTQIDVAATRTREDERAIARWKAPDGLEREPLKRHVAHASARLHVPDTAVRVGTAHVDDSFLEVEVAMLERKQLCRSQPCAGGENDHRPVHRTEMGSDRQDLSPRLERPLLHSR